MYEYSIDALGPVLYVALVKAGRLGDVGNVKLSYLTSCCSFFTFCLAWCPFTRLNNILSRNIITDVRHKNLLNRTEDKKIKLLILIGHEKDD